MNWLYRVREQEIVIAAYIQFAISAEYASENAEGERCNADQRKEQPIQVCFMQYGIQLVRSGKEHCAKHHEHVPEYNHKQHLHTGALLLTLPFIVCERGQQLLDLLFYQYLKHLLPPVQGRYPQGSYRP